MQSGNTNLPSGFALLCSHAIVLAAATFSLRYYYAKSSNGGCCDEEEDGDKYAIKTVADLRRVIPAGSSGSCLSDAPKVLDHLDDQMDGFIRRSPFIHLATTDKDGVVHVSPKGDEPGFVAIVNPKKLIIPDRPGNRLILGLRAIVEGNPNVGICFQIPGNNATLRLGGRARLTVDPQLLTDMAARGVDATVAIVVEIQYSFFHCSKAYIRSKIWKPETWPFRKDLYGVSHGAYFTKNPTIQSIIDKEVETHYAAVQDAVDGKVPEPI